MVEKILSWIAPHYCISCLAEGFVLCSSCIISSTYRVNERCYKCYKVSANNKTCKKCRTDSPLEYVWPAALYEGFTKELLSRLKFSRAKAAAIDAAAMIDSSLPCLERIMIIPIPTASRRVRMRGYDQSVLIAKELARLRGWSYSRALSRTTSTRQTGATRITRKHQIKDAFRISKKINYSGFHILLIDDILTTGATLQEAARLLKAAGVKSVSAAVVAQKM